LKNVNDVDTALSFYHLAGVSIDQGMLSVVLNLDGLMYDNKNSFLCYTPIVNQQSNVL
jgi:hypothetical protein